MSVVNNCCSLFWFLFSVVVSHQAFRLPLGEMRDPSAGFFPLLIALITGLLSLLAPFQSLKEKAQQEATAPGSTARFRWWHLVVILVTLISFALTLTKVGFMIDTLLFMLLFLKVIEPQLWKKAGLASLITAVTSNLFFNMLPESQRGIFLKESLPCHYEGRTL